MSERMLEEFRERAVDLVSVPDLSELQRRGTGRRRMRIAAGAAVLASVLAIGGAVAISPPNDEKPISAARSDAEEVAGGFLDAYGALDADKAITYLTDSAIAQTWGSPEKFRLQVSYLRAIGYKQTVTGCEPSRAAPASLRCAFDLQALRSDEIGLDPYPDNYWYLTIRDGKIHSATWVWGNMTFWFLRQVWDPFRNWVTTEHPDDAAIMYAVNPDEPRIAEESIQLWQRRTREYVTVVRRDPATSINQPAVAAYVAQVQSICSAAHARLNDELQAAGVELKPVTVSAPYADPKVQFTVAKEEDRSAYEDAARAVMGQTLPEFGALRPPETVRPSYEALAFPLMQRFAKGGEAPYTPPPAASWTHAVERFPGLYDCTFNLGR